MVGPLIVALGGTASSARDWRTASRESVGIAPDPAVVQDAVVQVYGARAYGWRGAFAVHTWISVKRTGAPQFTTYEVIGWRYWHSGEPLAVRRGAPDRRWFGAEPEVYVDMRGPEVEEVIDRIEAAVANYAHTEYYRTWPGPNSNTFTASIAREVPELRLDLPPTAIGKDFLENGSVVAQSPSGTGIQFSLFGLLGIMVALEEGLEINLLGLTLGIDPGDLAVKLPGIGRIGVRD